VAHTVIPSPKSTAATRELTHKGDDNYETITEREREILDFNVTLLTGVITLCQHLVVDTQRTYVGRTRQHCQNIKHIELPAKILDYFLRSNKSKINQTHQMIVTVNRTCVLLTTEDMITKRINTHLAGTVHATLGVGKHLWDGVPKTPAEKSLPSLANIWREARLCHFYYNKGKRNDPTMETTSFP